LAEITNLIKQGGGEAIYVVADVAERAQVQAIADAAIEHFGRIDTWINDAGVTIFGKLGEVSEQDNRRLFDINFWGVVNGSLVALPYLARQGGALINLGSELSEAVVPLQGMYSASKHAVKGFTDALRVEVEQVDKLPVAITLIQPTAVDTPFAQHARNYLDTEPQLPKPMVEPEDVAKAILKAATNATRSEKVGAMAVVNTAMSKFIPALAERMVAKKFDQQHTAEAPRHPEGGLYHAVGDGHLHGRQPRTH
jgi:short-subunit dehydrogenase